MKVYRVGGSVRDKILGKLAKDNDYVVVGSSTEEMLANGFKQVGKDFPVFLHPETNEEYALARKERKTGKGYKGFDFNCEKDVTLEDDLCRRDLTINAIAEDEDGNLIDPFNGIQDIKRKKLKAVSKAFSEDPLRALRVARFMSQLNGFTIHEDTESQLITISKNEELHSLSRERVWDEVSKALNYDFLKFLLVIKKYKLEEPWFSKIENVPKEISKSMHVENIWCFISRLNHYSFGNYLVHKKTFRVFIKVWKGLDMLNSTRNREKLIQTLGELSSSKYEKILKDIINYRNDPKKFLDIFNDFNKKDFSHLIDFDSEQVIEEKNKIWDSLIVKYNLLKK